MMCVWDSRSISVEDVDVDAVGWADQEPRMVRMGDIVSYVM